MRKFFSYGSPDTEDHYYAPRKELLEEIYHHLIGDNPKKDGHYSTVWAPRQTGKSWCLNMVRYRLAAEKQFDAVKISLEALKNQTDTVKVINVIVRDIFKQLGKKPVILESVEDFTEIFSRETLDNPLILILDEFDALKKEVIHNIVGTFRAIYNSRNEQTDKNTEEKDYLLHGLALIGVRRVLGVESTSGSPFNVQRSIRIPNLTETEVWEMFKWYQKESGQVVEKEAVDRLYFETRGQPGLTCWFGELLTEGWKDSRLNDDRPIDLAWFNRAYNAALAVMPNNNVLNILSKAQEAEHKGFIIDLFRTEEKVNFHFNNRHHNYLYLNGVIDEEIVIDNDGEHYYVRFSCPFIQNTLFQSFSDEIFSRMTDLIDPFTDLGAVISPDHINIKIILEWYQTYLRQNREWILKEAQRRSDLQVHEAVFHFNLYMYLHKLIPVEIARVLPEFPTGNGKIDLLIRSGTKTYGLELKAFKNTHYYKNALTQASRYGKQLNLTEITLVFFIHKIDEPNRQKLEIPHTDKESGVCVTPVFIETVLPLFSGIYRMGAGIGPATAFLYSGPAINVLAIILTARILGTPLGIARAVGAIVFSIVIGLSMHFLFRKEEAEKRANMPPLPEVEVKRPLWQNVMFFALMVAILVFANWGKPDGNSGFWFEVHTWKWGITSLSALFLGLVLFRWFEMKWWKLIVISIPVVGLAFAFPRHPIVAFAAGAIGLGFFTSTDKGETGEWFDQTWDFTKQIMPLLLFGVLIAGLLLGRPGQEGLIPSEWVDWAVGGNSLRSNLFASVVGAFMYFATLTEIPILQGLIGNGMGKGPALALLLSGPALSLPNMLVIRGVLGNKKTVTFVMLVIIMSMICGMIFGSFF